jgi:DNA recombination protein RmuC
MELIYLILSILAILLILKIILTLQACKKETGNELTEIKSSIGKLTSNLKDTEKNLKDEFVNNRSEIAETATGLRTKIGNQLNNAQMMFQ